MSRDEFAACSIAERAALVEAWQSKEKREVQRLRVTERAADRRFATLMAVLVNATRGTKLEPEDFLKSKRKRRKANNDAAAQRFFAPLIAAGLVKEEPIHDSN